MLLGSIQTCYSSKQMQIIAHPFWTNVVIYLRKHYQLLIGIENSKKKRTLTIKIDEHAPVFRKAKCTKFLEIGYDVLCRFFSALEASELETRVST